MARISDKVRRLVFERDGGRCPHCGETEAIGLQHRISKGMGGSKLLDVPSNLLTFCNIGNARMESDAQFAAIARANGWKLGRWDNPLEIPVLLWGIDERYILDNTFGKKRSI